MEPFGLKVFTPAGLAVEETVLAVSLPSASRGEIGFLPGHTRYTGTVGTGILSYQAENTEHLKEIAVTGGFASFDNNTLSILADDVVMRETVDLETYAEKRSELEKVVTEGSGYDPEWQAASQKLAWIEVIDQLIQH